MYVNNETTFGMAFAASALGKKHPSGEWLTDRLLANINKVHVATLPYETKRLTEDMGGIGETGCLPSYVDFNNPTDGHLVQKYLKAASAESRAKIARLIEWLTLGVGSRRTHEGGSPEAAKLIELNSGLEKSVEYARRLFGLRKRSRTGTQEVGSP